MAVRQEIEKVPEPIPMLKTVEQMSSISGLGSNKLRTLMENGEIEYIQNGNRRLLTNKAIWDWYMRNRVVPGCNTAKKMHDLCR